MDERPVDPVAAPVNLTATFNLPARSVIIPAWLLLCCLGCFVMAAVGLILVWQSNVEMRREIRILQVHTQDVESALIRASVASRSDFAAWGDGAPRHEKPEEEKK